MWPQSVPTKGYVVRPLLLRLASEGGSQRGSQGKQQWPCSVPRIEASARPLPLCAWRQKAGGTRPQVKIVVANLRSPRLRRTQGHWLFVLRQWGGSVAVEVSSNGRAPSPQGRKRLGHARFVWRQRDESSRPLSKAAVSALRPRKEGGRSATVALLCEREGGSAAAKGGSSGHRSVPTMKECVRAMNKKEQ